MSSESRGPGPNNTPQFEEVVKQEVELLSRQFPTPDDIPGCIKLFDKAIVCNGTFSIYHFLRRPPTNIYISLGRWLPSKLIARPIF